MVKGGEIKRLHGLGFPQTECVASAHPVTQDRRVISLALDLRVGKPVDPVLSVFVFARFGVATEFHFVVDFGPDDFAWIAIA